MRKAQKNELIKLLGELVKAQELLTSFEKKESNAVLSLLADCQNNAIIMGNQIECIEGEGTKCVILLEQYCELIFQIYQEIEKSEEFIQQVQEKLKDVNSLLFEIAESIEHDIPTQKEVVFLPYKACMWDSLESIWRAACEDPLCDAYVIPIPYFDKKQDGTVEEMQYEADLFPDYVPIAHYNSYDFQSKRPDAIFFHNPYDGANIVTTVHPFFYASNLKQFTDMLVYIPYFILNEIDPNDEATIETMKHQCVLPAMFHANKVIVQSNAMKQIFVNELSNFVGEHTRSYFEQVVEPWGSPKVDCFLQKMNDKAIVPDEWKKKIGKKQVIFYNTSIGALLFWGEAYLKKVEMVFRYFQHQENKILLWRPHPLMEATIRSMRSEFCGRWDELQSFFLQNDVGILDTSADMYPALAASDAYYGDPSSVASLYLHSDKPEWMHGFETDENGVHLLDIETDFEERRKVKTPEYEKYDDTYHTVGQRIYSQLLGEIK